jgi:hypothetical protein
MLDRLPDEMKVLMQHVNHECNVLAHHAGSMGWSVDFQIKNTNLSLIYDRGLLVVKKDPGGSEKNLIPKNKDMFSVTMEDLANEVNNEFAYKRMQSDAAEPRR